MLCLYPQEWDTTKTLLGIAEYNLPNHCLQHVYMRNCMPMYVIIWAHLYIKHHVVKNKILSHFLSKLTLAEEIFLH